MKPSVYSWEMPQLSVLLMAVPVLMVMQLLIQPVTCDCGSVPIMEVPLSSEQFAWMSPLGVEPLRYPTSNIQCAVLCANTLNCSLYLHHTELHQCALYGLARPNATVITIDANDINWKAFTVVANCSYIYARSVDKCYYIEPNAKINSEAISICQSYGGTLKEFRTTVELELVRDLLQADPDLSVVGYWIGAQRSPTDGNFYWQSNQSESVSTELWGTKQPDSNNENCVDMFSEVAYYLNDVSCKTNVQRAVICDIPM